MIASISTIGEKVRFVGAKIAVSHAQAVDGSLGLLLDRLEQTAWPNLLWRFSALCNDGCPVEFTFSSVDDAVRYTTEVAGPELREHLRLHAACAWLHELGLPFPPASLLAGWQTLQQDAALRWGSWLGLRHRHGACSAKLYIEVPRNRHHQGSRPLTPSSRLHMIGFDLATGATEHYYRLSGLDDTDHRTLLFNFRRYEQWPRLLESVSALYGMPGEAALRWMDLGYSLRQDQAAGLTLFVRPEACGGASRVRKEFLRTMRSGQARESAYAALLGSLADHRLPEHGVVAIAVGPSGEVELRVGVSARALAERLAN